MSFPISPSNPGPTAISGIPPNMTDSLQVSQTSKSICGNLNSRLKNGGTRSDDLESGRPAFRGMAMCGVNEREGGGDVRKAFISPSVDVTGLGGLGC